MKLVCAECGCTSNKTAVGWRAYLAGGFDGEQVEVIVLCRSCAVREFGSRATH